MNIRASRKEIEAGLVKASKEGGNTEAMVKKMETAIQDEVSQIATSSPHVRTSGESSATHDPFQFGVNTFIEGDPLVVRKAVAEVLLDLIGQGAKVSHEISPVAGKPGCHVHLRIDLNAVEA